MQISGVKVLVAVLGLALNCAAATDYCSLCNNHIACGNDGSFADSCPSDAEIIPISSSLRDAIVDEHNKLRQKVASGSFDVFDGAARMATMQWDDELAQLAELNVKQCVMRHDGCRDTANYKYAGQNLANSGWSGWTRSVSSVLVSHINLWFDEYKDCSMQYINSYSRPSDGSVIGHFTQVVNDKAHRVGCAILRMTKNGFTYQLMACNYSRTNILGYPIYDASSSPASGCTTGTNPSYPSLCSVNESINPNGV